MKSVLVLTYWSYRSGLVQAYTLPYVRMISRRLAPGGRVFLVTLEQDGMALDPGRSAGEARELESEGIVWIPLPYRRFGLGAAFRVAGHCLRLALMCLRERVEVIHTFCTPAGGLGVLLSAVTGIPLILDSYEPHAEGMLEYGVWKRSGLAFKVLFALEFLQSRRAVAVVAAAPAMREYAKTKYGAEFERFFVKPACVDLRHFSRDGIDVAALREQKGLKDMVVCVYAGKTGGTYLEREIFDFFKAASDRWKGRFKALFLSSDDPDLLRTYCEQSGFDPSGLIHSFVDHRDVPSYMALADFALTPVKPLPIKRYCAPIKNGEYWAMGLPVVITPGIASDSEEIARRGIGAVLEGLDRVSYDRALDRIESLLRAESRPALAARIRGVAVETRGLGIAEAVYDSLYGPARPEPGAPSV